MLETGFRLTVNGVERSASCEPDTPLLDVLRHDLGLAGPRFGCGMGLCGACFVLIGDRTSTSPDEGVTAGSLSVEDSGSALRQACAQARGLLLDAAARGLEVPRAALDVADGQIRTPDGPTRLSYWTLAQSGMLAPPAE